VTALLDFTIPFSGGAAYFTGVASSVLVPNVFPVAINGRPYLIDSKSGEFSRQFDDRVRNSMDQSNEPGESSINSQGLWRRSQSSWHYGAGQEYSDTPDAENYRFHYSKGVNVWERGKLSLLNDTSVGYSTSNTNLYMASASNRIYGSDGHSVKYTTDWSTFVTVTSTDASDIYSLASDGYNVFFSYANGDIDQTNAGTSAASNYITGIEAGKIVYARGRLMVAGQGTDKRKIWNITTTPGTSANNPSALFTHPNDDFNWVGFAGGQNNIYCAGYAGNKSFVYKTAIKADGTALDIPTVAAELPQGEVIHEIDSYLGYILIGTDLGIRFCSSDGDGNLVVGPLIKIGHPVKCFAGIGQYVYFGWTNYDTVSTGIGRMDVGTQVVTNQPAYATDLMATGQGTVVDLHEFGNKPVFTVSGLGAYRPHATNLVASGTLDTGLFRWGVMDPKFIPKWDLHTESLNGSVSFSISPNNEGFENIGTASAIGSSSTTFNGLEPYVFDAEVRLTLTPTTDLLTSPTVNRWMGRAYAAPFRSEIFSVPVLLYKQVNVRGRDYFFDVEEELTQLRLLVSAPSVISYQENNTKYSVIVENIQWKPVDSPQSPGEWDWDGTCVIIMRSVR
jgi:hypothetical protein